MRTKTKIKDDDVNKLERLIAVIDEFGTYDKDMPMQMIRAFLLAALHDGKEGPYELARHAKIGPTVMSRHILDLGEINRYRKAGYNLVAQETDPDDRRRRVVSLTSKGVQLRNAITRHMK